MGADGREVGARRGSQVEKCPYDMKNQMPPVVNVELVMQPLKVGVDCMRGTAEVVSDGGLGLAVEDAAHDL